MGAWLFPEIGLAATLHLHCSDWREGSKGGCFSLRPLVETTQQVNSRFTVAAPGKVSGKRGKQIKILRTNGYGWGKVKRIHGGLPGRVNLKLIPLNKLTKPLAGDCVGVLGAAEMEKKGKEKVQNVSFRHQSVQLPAS